MINYLDVAFKKGELKVSPYQAYAGVRAASPLGEIIHRYQVPWQPAKQMDADALSIMQQNQCRYPEKKGFVTFV